jgi:methionine-rich copper-binding protein CopC
MRRRPPHPLAVIGNTAKVHPRRTDAARRVLAVMTAAAAVTAIVLASPSAAGAHAALLSSTPRDASTVVTPPRDVTLTFDQSIEQQGAQVAVTDTAGTKVNDTAPHVNGAVVVQHVPVLEPGTFTVAYRVVSADGHPVQGVLSFTVGSAISPPSPTARVHRSGRLVWTYGVLALLLVGLAAAGIVLASNDRSKRGG